MQDFHDHRPAWKPGDIYVIARRITRGGYVGYLFRMPKKATVYLDTSDVGAFATILIRPVRT
jgi:hypothetical protein